MKRSVVVRVGPHRLTTTDLIVVLGMVLVAVALGVGLHLQIGISAGVAAVVALTAGAALLAVHVLVRRSGALKGEVARLQAELDVLNGLRGIAGEVPPARRTASAAPPAPPAGPRAREAAQMQPSPDPAAKGRAGEPPSARRGEATIPPLSLTMDAPPPTVAPEIAGPALKAPVRGAAAAGPPAEALQELWSFRPSSPPELSSGSAPDATPMASITPREADVELIQGLIKKLAEEVNATEPPAANRKASPPRSAEATEAAIEVSLEALRTAAETMRGARPVTGDLPAPQGSAKAAATRPPQAPEAPLPSGEARSSKEVTAASPPRREPAPAISSPAVQARLAALTDAITAGRVDVLLEPILGLEDQRARHFEVSLRLRGKADETLDAPREDAELRGTGLLPMLDCVSISRTAQVARRLADRGRPGAVLSSLSAEALGHDAFLNEIAEAYRSHDRFADQLVLAFSQSDVRALAPHEWETLADMRDLGFRFALQAVTDLDMDFDSLKTKGFSFVKLDADVFLEGMPAPGGPLPAADICRHLAELGLTLIVGGIDDETKLARIFGFGALLGQGQMFGGPRPVKAEALGSHPAAA